MNRRLIHLRAAMPALGEGNARPTRERAIEGVAAYARRAGDRVVTRRREPNE